MQGFVLGVRKVKEEDLLVTVITDNRVKTMYRFYGARHSSINLGYKIDFSSEPIQNITLLRLRDVTHLGFPWLQDRSKLVAWQSFCILLYEHLKEVNEHGGFYFEMLQTAAIKLEKSSPKRTLLEAYLSMLKNEGRFHEPTECFFCSEELAGDDTISLARGFLPSHEKCIFQPGFKRDNLLDFFHTGKSMSLDEHEVEALYSIMMMGF